MTDTIAISRIQELRAAGLTFADIATKLNAEGLKTSTKRKWMQKNVANFFYAHPTKKTAGASTAVKTKATALLDESLADQLWQKLPASKKAAALVSVF